MFALSSYRLFVLNRGWKRESFQIGILVYVCSVCSVVELKTGFETWKARNVVNGVNLFHLSYLITHMAYVCSLWASNVLINNFMLECSNYVLLVLNRAWKRDFLQIILFVYVCSTWSLVELKTRFETRITRNDVNGVSLFHLSYVITLLAYLWSQRTPHFQIKYFMFDWSIYILFVLNRAWKRDSLQIMLFVYIWSTWGIVDLKNAFWDVNNKKWGKRFTFV
jgi:hypothetical protein